KARFSRNALLGALFIVRIDADFVGRRGQPLVAGDVVPSVFNDRSRHGAFVLGRMEFNSSLIQQLAFELHGARNREPRVTRTAAEDNRCSESRKEESPQGLHEPSSGQQRELPAVHRHQVHRAPSKEKRPNWTIVWIGPPRVTSATTLDCLLYLAGTRSWPGLIPARGESGEATPAPELPSPP